MAGIFISYRRDDARADAGRLSDHLVAAFGRDQVFMDVDTLQPGEDFQEAIRRALSACDVLVAVIGNRWLEVDDEAGGRRLDDPADPVRLEIETALAKNARVVPVLVGDARLPKANDLPPSIAPLVRRQALGLSHERWNHDVQRLVEAIRRAAERTPEPDELERATLRQRPSLEPATPEEIRHARLPAPATPLVGRREELEGALVFLRGVCRLLTFTGPGGTGKTRLALEAAWQLASEFDQHACFVDLASVSSFEQVPAAIVQALDVAERPGEPLVATLKREVAGGRSLLLLDNFEHVLDAAPVVADLLRAAPALKVIATSREPLRIQAEQEYPLDPLIEADAVELFCDRARAHDPAFEPEDPETLIEICRRLDGLPLALELAAARVRSITPRGLLERLERRLPVLTAGLRDAPRRQQTLAAAIDWSYAMLSEDEQRLQRRLSVFAGGSRADDAAAVCDVTKPDAVDRLASLAEKSLLRRRVDPDGQPRYRMLETIREHAGDRLDEAGEADDLRRRHAEHFRALAEEAEEELHGAEQGAWLERLASEHENMVAAAEWAIGAAPEVALALTAALGPFWDRRGYLEEGARLLRDALAVPAQAAEVPRAQALRSLAWLLLRRGERAAARAAADEAHRLFVSANDRAGLSRVLAVLSFLTAEEGDLEQATALGEETRALVRELGMGHAYEVMTSNLAYYALRAGDYERARTLATEILAVQREIGNTLGVAVTLLNLAGASIRLGEDSQAASQIAEALELAAALAVTGLVADCLCVLSVVASSGGDPEAAARLVGAADSLYERVGAEPESFERETRELALEAARRRLDEVRFERAYEAGRAVDVGEAMAFAHECSAALASI
jgi:predicted ATPase